MLLGSIRNRVTRNKDVDKNREMKKKSYVQTVKASWLVSLGIGLKYFTLYAVSVNGALPLPSCICSMWLTRRLWVQSLLDGMNYYFVIFLFFRFGTKVKARRWVPPLNTQYFEKFGEKFGTECLNTRSLPSSAYPPVCVIQRETDLLT